MAELKPNLRECPFCGSKATVYVNKVGATEMYGVTCMCCTARIVGYTSRELAEAKWNRRIDNER